MFKTTTDKRVLTELFEIFRNSETEVIKCIPLNIIQFVKQNRDISYKVDLVEGKSLDEQNLLPETKVIIAWIYKQYLQESEKYITSPIKIKEDIFEKKDFYEEKEENSLPIIQEKCYQKIFKKISKLFKR